MASSSAPSAITAMLSGQLPALSGWNPTHQDVPASALAATALAATATVAMPRHGLHKGSMLVQALRRCSPVGSGATTTPRFGAVAGVGSGPWRLPIVARQAPGATAAAGAASPACTAGRVTGGAAGSSVPTLWSALRGQHQHHQQHQQRAGRLLQSVFGRAYSSGTAVAATTAAAAGGAAGPAMAVRCGLLAGRGAGAAGGEMSRAFSLRRLMATQASGASSSTAAAAGGGGLVTRFRGRLGEALRLQLAAAWQAYGTAAYVGAALAAVFVVWRLMRSTTNLFIAVNDRMAEYGIMALAASLVLLAALYLRWRTAVQPAAVYRQAMVQLNTSPGVLEVMGAPLVGSPVRAYVVTGGGLYLSKRFRIKLRSRRIQMMFPLSGPERKGLVSLEAKRKHGRYVWKLLAVDLGPELQSALPAGGRTGLSAAPPPPPRHTSASPPSPSPQQQQQPDSAPSLGTSAALLAPDQQRVYVVGDLAAYQRGGVLGELRAPFLKALGNSRSYEVEDELEDELDELDLPSKSNSKSNLKAAGAAVRKAVESAAAAFTSKPPPPPLAPSAAAAAAAAESAGAGTSSLGGGGASASAAPASQNGGVQGQTVRAADASGDGGGAVTADSPTHGSPSGSSGSTGSLWRRLRGLVEGSGAAAK